MPLLANIDSTAFNALPDESVIGKDLFKVNEKTGNFDLLMDGAEAGKLAIPLQTEVEKLRQNNQKLLDEKIKKQSDLEPFTKLGKTAAEIEEILKSGKTPAMDDQEKVHLAQIESLKTEHQKALNAAQEAVDASKTDAVDTRKHLVATMKENMIARLKQDFDMNELADDWFSNRIEIVFSEDAKKYEPRVLKNGEVAYKATQFMTPAQLAEEARENKSLAGMFNAGTGAGSGAPTRQASANPLNGTVRATDFDAIGANLEDIASGKVKVV